MKRLFISDIHVGDFASRYYRAIKLINEEKPDELYLVGDIFDLWKDKLNTIQRKHSEVFTALYRLSLTSKVILIIGNHEKGLNTDDNYFKHFVFASSFVINTNNRKIKVIHGHEYDKFVTKFYPVARFCSFVHRLFIRAFNIDLRYKFSLSSKNKKRNYPNVLDVIKERAVEDNKDYDVLIMGHTHSPEQIKINNMEYINLGDWFEDFTYAIEKDGKICLKKIKKQYPYS